jgi:hypothetical protein
MCGMEWLTSPEIWISLLTLTVLEIVLGIDNIVFSESQVRDAAPWCDGVGRSLFSNRCNFLPEDR